MVYKSRDVFFMEAALREARKAYEKDEVPVGAVIVGPDDTIIARAHNLVEKKQTQTAHAELLALAKAGKKIGWRLEGCRMYVTLEPCSMCMGAIKLSRLDVLIYGAHSPLFGYQLDKSSDLSLYQVPVKVHEGVCAQQSEQLLKAFFQQKRRRKHNGKRKREAASAG